MKLHALVELEEGGLTVVVAGREGRVPRVVRSTRVPLAALTPEEVSSGLLSVSDHFDGVDGVHVLFGDRRARCFTTKLPASSVTSFGMKSSRAIICSTTGWRPARMSSPNSAVITGRTYPWRFATSASPAWTSISAVRSAVSCRREVARVRESRSSENSRASRIPISSSAATTRSVLRFFRRREYESLGDPSLSSLCGFYRTFTSVYSGLFVVMVASFCLEWIAHG